VVTVSDLDRTTMIRDDSILFSRLYSRMVFSSDGLPSFVYSVVRTVETGLPFTIVISAIVNVVLVTSLVITFLIVITSFRDWARVTVG